MKETYLFVNMYMEPSHPSIIDDLILCKNICITKNIPFSPTILLIQNWFMVRDTAYYIPGQVILFCLSGENNIPQVIFFFLINICETTMDKCYIKQSHTLVFS
jgi:hypothetical protein